MSWQQSFKTKMQPHLTEAAVDQVSRSHVSQTLSHSATMLFVIHLGKFTLLCLGEELSGKSTQLHSPLPTRS